MLLERIDHDRQVIKSTTAAMKGEVEAFLKKLGYSHWNETDNPAYKLFLA